MHNPFKRFIIKAIAVLTIAFFIHLVVLKMIHLPLFENKIVLSYIVNVTLVIIIFGVLYISRKKYKAQLGFLFMAGSVLKFAVFFIAFYPFYKLDGHISKVEFASFFTPYCIGLILETFSLVKWLNKSQ